MANSVLLTRQTCHSEILVKCLSSFPILRGDGHDHHHGQLTKPDPWSPLGRLGLREAQGAPRVPAQTVPGTSNPRGTLLAANSDSGMNLRFQSSPRQADIAVSRSPLDPQPFSDGAWAAASLPCPTAPAHSTCTCHQRDLESTERLTPGPGRAASPRNLVFSVFLKN